MRPFFCSDKLCQLQMKDHSTMIFKLSKPWFSERLLFHSFLLIVGVSVGVVSTLCLRTFSFTIPSIPFFNPHLTTIIRPSNGTLTLSKHTTAIISPLEVKEKEKEKENQTALISLMHNMTDDELFVKASSIPQKAQNDPPDFKHKVAFMFLTPGPLPLSPFWDKFLHGHQDKFSIYVHPHPSFNYSFPQDSVFHGRQIPSQPVEWGTVSMIDAERRLLGNALLEPANRRFVLVSDSCIPVFNFTTVYDYLMGTNQSFLGSFDDPRKPGRGRYNRQMWPTVSIEQWRKGSQWFELHRGLAERIVADKTYHGVFRDLCRPPCYSDEHYLPTLVNILYPEMNSNRSITWVDWSRGGPHPRMFGWADVNAELLNWIRVGSECEYNGEKTNVCFLFARKFLPNTIGPLMQIGPSILGLD